MKIVFDHQIFGWQKYGGISRYLCEIAKEMSNTLNQNVAIVCPFYVNAYLKNASKRLRILGLPIPIFPKFGRIFRAINFLFVWPTMHYLKPDIIHETYYALRRTGPKRSKVVLTVHDMIHERFSNQTIKSNLISREKFAAISRADHIICVSKQTRQDLIDILKVSPDKITVVYLGFSLNVASNNSIQVDKKHRPFLLYVGAREGYKNFNSLLKAYASSSELKLKFDLVCFGGKPFSKKEIAHMYELSLNVTQIKHVSGDDKVLAGYYKAAYAFIYPSLYEGFGIPPLEAMSFDCPVICSNSSSIPEVVGEAAEMFNPDDYKSIQFAIERVLHDDELRKSLVLRGRERVKKFSWNKCAQETLDVYRKLLEKDC